MAARKKTQSSKPTAKSKQSRSKAPAIELGDDAELSPAQQRELESRIEDLNDRNRYLLASSLGPNFVLYYNLSQDTYGWNDPAHATLFKRQAAAHAIQQLLDNKDSIVKCEVDKKGKLIAKSVGKPGASAAKAAGKKSKKKASDKAPAKKASRKAPAKKTSRK